MDNMALAERLPEPESNKGRIISNSSEGLSVYIAKTSQNDYYDYVEKCKTKGLLLTQATLLLHMRLIIMKAISSAYFITKAMRNSISLSTRR